MKGTPRFKNVDEMRKAMEADAHAIRRRHALAYSGGGAVQCKECGKRIAQSGRIYCDQICSQRWHSKNRPPRNRVK